MQAAGYVVLDGEKILVLVRQKKFCRAIKRRYSGKDGRHFTDEELYLNMQENEHIKQKLLAGEVINI